MMSTDWTHVFLVAGGLAGFFFGGSIISLVLGMEKWYF